MACVWLLPCLHGRDDITAGYRERERPLDWTHIPCVRTHKPSVHPFMSDKQEPARQINTADDKRHIHAHHPSAISRWSQTSVKAGFSRTNSIMAVSLIALPVCFHRLWMVCILYLKLCSILSVRCALSWLLSSEMFSCLRHDTVFTQDWLYSLMYGVFKQWTPLIDLLNAME